MSESKHDCIKRTHRAWVKEIVPHAQEREATEAELKNLGIVPFEAGFRAGVEWQRTRSIASCPFVDGDHAEAFEMFKNNLKIR